MSLEISSKLSESMILPFAYGDGSKKVLFPWLKGWQGPHSSEKQNKRASVP